MRTRAPVAQLPGGVASVLGGALVGAMDFLLPPACASCGEAADGEVRAGEGPVCRRCRLRLPPVPPPICDRCGAPMGGGRASTCLECQEWPELLQSARAAHLLESPARELVHALKYHGWRDVGTFMGREMARAAPRTVAAAECIVPIPTSPANVRRRGYNQAEVIARSLAEALGTELLPCLERRGQRGTQTTLNPQERSANVSGAFALVGAFAGRIAGRRVLLVDDVITTGATILAAVGALRAADPRTVCAFAFARTVPLAI